MNAQELTVINEIYEALDGTSSAFELLSIGFEAGIAYNQSKIIVVWTKEWPTEPGHYWFYGWNWLGKDYLEAIARTAPKCTLVEVHQIKNGVMCVAKGNFMYKSERHIGLWSSADLPVPDLQTFNALLSDY